MSPGIAAVDQSFMEFFADISRTRLCRAPRPLAAWPFPREAVEAERLFLDAIYFRVSHREAVLRARELEASSELAGKYLKWLLALTRRGGGDTRSFGVTVAV